MPLKDQSVLVMMKRFLEDAVGQTLTLQEILRHITELTVIADNQEKNGSEKYGFFLSEGTKLYAFESHIDHRGGGPVPIRRNKSGPHPSECRLALREFTLSLEGRLTRRIIFDSFIEKTSMVPNKAMWQEVKEELREKGFLIVAGHGGAAHYQVTPAGKAAREKEEI